MIDERAGADGETDSRDDATGQSMDRRRLLELAGAATAMAGTWLAGCSSIDPGEGIGDDNGDGGGGTTDAPTDSPTDAPTDAKAKNPTDSPTESPTDARTETRTAARAGSAVTAPYDDWVVSELVEGRLLANTVDLSSMNEVTSREDSNEVPEDPLISAPWSLAFVTALSAGVLLGRVGLGRLIEADGPTELVHLVGSAVVLEGSFDAPTIGGTIEDNGGSADGSSGGFSIFEVETQDQVVAVSSETIISASAGEDVSDPGGYVETLVDVAGGGGTPYRADEAPYGELADALRKRQTMGVAYGMEGQSGTPTPGDDTPDFDGEALGFAAAADFEGSASTAAMAIRLTADSEVPSESEVEEEVAPNAEDVSVTIDAPMVHVTGRYPQFTSDG